MLKSIFKDQPPDTLISFWYRSDEDKHEYYSTYGHIPKFPSDIDIYFAPALRVSRGDKKSDVYGTRVLWVDIDNVDQKPLATLPPSLVMRSGGGFHYYWFLNEYITDIKLIEAFNKTLAGDVKGDMGCWNVNRFLRVPDTLNTRRGQYTRILNQSNSIYSPSQFTVLRKIADKTRHKIKTGDKRGFKTRSEQNWSVVSDLIHSAGASFEFVRALFSVTAVGDKFREMGEKGEHYLRHTYDKAADAPPKRLEKPAVIKATVDGISIKDDGFHVTSANGTRRLSTFTLTPRLILRVVGDDGESPEEAFLCDVSIGGTVIDLMTMHRSMFNDKRTFNKHMHRMDTVWLGTDHDIAILLLWLHARWNEAGAKASLSTKVLGYHKGLFVGSSQTLDGDSVTEGNDASLAYMPMGREAPVVHYNGSGEKVSWIHLLPQINDPTVTWPVIGWYFAAPLKVLFEKHHLRFPILNLHGTRGSGKTSLIRTMQRLIGYRIPRSYDCVTTPFVMRSILGSTNGVPVSFQEFRNETGRRLVQRYLLPAYDGGSDARGRADQTTIRYELTAPFTVDGEDAIMEAAAQHRIIIVKLSPLVIREKSPAYNAFMQLDGLPLSEFALGMMQHTLKADFPTLLSGAKKLIQDAFPASIQARVRNNYTVVTAGMLLFCSYTGLVMPDVHETLGKSLETIESPLLGRGPLLIDDFVATIVNAVSMGQGKFKFDYDKEANVLWVQLQTAFMWWEERRARTRQGTLQLKSLRSQLEERNLRKGDADNRGQYSLPAQLRMNTLMYGLSLQALTDSGIEVPQQLDLRSVTIFMEESKNA